MLYLVATPIGNLKDITYRAVEILRDCDYILCEDTRHSRTLMREYEIDTPLKSFHKFSEAKKEDAIIQDLKNGLTIALISDAGTPCISDPGSRLVRRCIDEEIQPQPVPGPCAAVAALIGSGKETERFQFVGFLPKKQGRLLRELTEYLEAPYTTICYESAKRIHKVLKLIDEAAPSHEIVIARELTKKYEEFRRGTAKELMEQSFKGELVILL